LANLLLGCREFSKPGKSLKMNRYQTAKSIAAGITGKSIANKLLLVH
jgi:hypothetical protein